MLSKPCQVLCSIRKKWIAATPEEKVRQALLIHMTQNLGYPSGNLALEISLSEMPHLRHAPLASIPRRRADLVVFAQGIHPHHSLYPLLLIECKAIPLTAKEERQVIGYNRYMQACFIGLANQQEQRMGWYDSQQKNFRFIPSIPPFSLLMSQSQAFFSSR